MRIPSRTNAPGGAAIKWYDQNRKMPNRFEPLLMYLPGDAPMQTVYEGYWSKDKDWRVNGGFHITQNDVARWAEMPNMIQRTMPTMEIMMTHDELKAMLGVSELRSVTREQAEQDLETILDIIDAGYSPVLITADGKPDLLLFSWNDYKRRFSILYPPGELERIEKEMQRYKETP